MTELTLMLCGPHRIPGTWTPMEHRVRGAIRVARETESVLVVSGDEWNGRDVEYFVAMARAAGVRSVGVENTGRCTKSDVIAALKLIKDSVRSAARVGVVVDLRVRVVTDWWHVDRAMAYLKGEANRLMPNRIPAFVASPVADGPTPPAEVVANEARGIEDYFRDPRSHTPRGEPYGKRFHGNPSDFEIRFGELEP